MSETARFSRHPEDFDCGHCGHRVLGNGYTNHCPACLWSRHVDVRPGDRAADCGGLMRPVAALYERGQTIIVQHCEACGHQWRNRSAADDDRDETLALFGRVVEPPSTSDRDIRRRRGR